MNYESKVGIAIYSAGVSVPDSVCTCFSWMWAWFMCAFALILCISSGC